ncbi:MAG: hypothetical protein QQN41_08055 [Nitrosopumilus sp.]
MNEKPDYGKYEKDTIDSCRKIEDEISVDELKKELRKEILDEGFTLMAIYLFLMDCDL